MSSRNVRKEPNLITVASLEYAHGRSRHQYYFIQREFDCRSDFHRVGHLFV
jgi:hypothetical protein